MILLVFMQLNEGIRTDGYTGGSQSVSSWSHFIVISRTVDGQTVTFPTQFQRVIDKFDIIAHYQHYVQIEHDIEHNNQYGARYSFLNTSLHSRWQY